MLQRLVENSATVHTRMFSTGEHFEGLQVQLGVRVSDATRGTYEPLAVSTAFVTMLCCRHWPRISPASTRGSATSIG